MRALILLKEMLPWESNIHLGKCKHHLALWSLNPVWQQDGPYASPNVSLNSLIERQGRPTDKQSSPNGKKSSFYLLCFNFISTSH
jgi:hypothetical protein